MFAHCKYQSPFIDVTRGNHISRSLLLRVSSFKSRRPFFPSFQTFPSPSFASRESQVVKSYYLALRDRESYVSLTCFTAWKRMGCLLEKHGGKHRSLCGNKVCSAARICILDEHDPISGTRIVSRGRSSLPIFLRRDRKDRALSKVSYRFPGVFLTVDKLRKIL